MKRKYIAADAVGACAEVLTAIILWNFTQIDVFGIVFWAMFAFIVGICIALAVSDRIEAKRKRRNRKYRGVRVITLDREEWERGRKSA